MKKIYCEPGISVTVFSDEKLLTASGSAVKALSADNKALEALSQEGTTHNMTVIW